MPYQNDLQFHLLLDRTLIQHNSTQYINMSITLSESRRRRGTVGEDDDGDAVGEGGTAAGSAGFGREEDEGCRGDGWVRWDESERE